MTGPNVTPEMTDAALAVLAEHFAIGGSANVADHVHDGQTAEERAAGLEAMRAADERIDAEVRAVVRDAIAAALAASLSAGEEVARASGVDAAYIADDEDGSAREGP